MRGFVHWRSSLKSLYDARPKLSLVEARQSGFARTRIASQANDAQRLVLRIAELLQGTL